MGLSIVGKIRIGLDVGVKDEETRTASDSMSYQINRAIHPWFDCGGRGYSKDCLLRICDYMGCRIALASLSYATCLWI